MDGIIHDYYREAAWLILMGNPDKPACQESVRLSSVVPACPRPHTMGTRQRPMDRRGWPEPAGQPGQSEERIKRGTR